MRSGETINADTVPCTKPPFLTWRASLARRGSGCFLFRAGNVGLVIDMVGGLAGERREQNEGQLEQVELEFRGCE